MFPVVAKQYIARNKKLKELGFENYKQYLSSDLWKAIKAKWRERMKKKPEVWGVCRICGRMDHLLLHHIKYSKITKIVLSGFIPLCFSCHHKVHEYIKSHPEASLKSAVRKIKPPPKVATEEPSVLNWNYLIENMCPRCGTFIKLKKGFWVCKWCKFSIIKEKKEALASNYTY